MLVHSFSPTNAWFEDYAAFGRALGVEVEPDAMIRLGERDGVGLHLAWIKGEPAFLDA